MTNDGDTTDRRKGERRIVISFRGRYARIGEGSKDERRPDSDRRGAQARELAVAARAAVPSSLDTAPAISNYVNDRPAPADHPSCHVCGATFTRKGDGWECLSCGATSAPTPVQPAGARPDGLTEWDFDIPRNNKFVDWPAVAAASVPVQPVTEQEAREWLIQQLIREKYSRDATPSELKTAKDKPLYISGVALGFEKTTNLLVAFANRTAPAATKEK